MERFFSSSVVERETVMGQKSGKGLEQKKIRFKSKRAKK